MIETLGRAGWTLGEALENEDDLEQVKRALIREQTIRRTMNETGESRKIVTQTLDAMGSMGQEFVLELTDGQPTTLRDGISGLVEELENYEEETGDLRTVADQLSALLAYPWSEEEAVIGTHGANDSVRLKIENPDDRHLIVTVGGQEVASANHDEEGWSGMAAVEDAARATHRAVLARVIGDREHIVQLNAQQVRALLDWADGAGSSGSHVTGVDNRLTVEAMTGGGLLIRTRPYTYVTPPRSR